MDAPNQRTGNLLEMGPDGYGYLIDQQRPEAAHAFHVSMFDEEFRGNPVELEGALVTYSLDSAGVCRVRLLNRPEMNRAAKGATP